MWSKKKEVKIEMFQQDAETADWGGSAMQAGRKESI
jgi:hypothetical protein